MKKFTKALAFAVAIVIAVTAFAACGAKKDEGAASNPPAANTDNTQAQAPADNNAAAPEPAAAVSPYADLGLDENLRFTETRKITVEVYDRNNEGGTKPDDNFYSNWIKEQMLAKHNVEVSFVPVARFTEGEDIANLLAAGNAPDVCVTYSYPTIQTYANMGGVVDLTPYIDGYKDLFPNLWGWLEESNMHWNTDPNTGTNYALEARLYNSARIGTFVREDWLKKLNLSEPTTVDEFEAMLQAFKDNADTLLGADASKMIPFSISFDAGWRADHLLTSYFPDSFVMSDRDYYVYGYDDRHLMYEGYKEGVRKLNDWYNKGFIWKDFPLYGANDTATEDNLLKAGYVGAFIHNWDYPYRNGDDSIHSTLRRMTGDDTAAFVAVEPFKNDVGAYRKLLSAPIDRKVFLPATNKEPIASLLYLDWMSTLENRKFIQIGTEGINHEVLADGTIKTMPATGEMIMNSLNNIDYTIVINGIDLGDKDLTVRSMAEGYANVESKYIEKALSASLHDARYGINVNFGEVKSEDGMAASLKEKRDSFLDQSIVATPDKFDSVYDGGYKDFLNSGGQAIIDERAEKWKANYGDANMKP